MGVFGAKKHSAEKIDQIYCFGRFWPEHLFWAQNLQRIVQECYKLFSFKNLVNYFFQKTKKINSNIVLEGSKLQIKIWKELIKIPYGKTKSYGEIAKIVKTSPRYVGNVCGQNKHLLIVPCHRVIRTDGSLGGFSSRGGLSLKKRLLSMENVKK